MRLPLPPHFRPGRLFSYWLGLSVTLTILRTEPARAVEAVSGGRLQLEWQTQEPGCEAANIVDEALKLVGPSAVPRPIAATAQVWRRGSEWVVQLDTHSASQTGRRVLSSPSCQDLRQAIALLLAMILESEGDPDDVELPEPTPTPVANTELGLDWLVQTAGSTGWRLKPTMAWGVGAAAGLRFRIWEASLAFMYWPATSKQVAGGGQLQIDREDASLALCADLALIASLALVPCISPAVTLFGSSASGIVEAQPRRLTPQVGVHASLSVRYWLPGQHFFAALGSGVTWERPRPFTIRYTCEDEELPECEPRDVLVYKTGGIAPRITLAIGARF